MRVAPLLLAGLLAACTQGAARELPAHEKHPGEVTFVSLNPCTDAILAEVADPAQVLALSHFSSQPGSSSMDPARARSFASVSGSVEEVAALGPDVVLSGNYDAPATVSAWHRLGLRVEQVPIAGSVAASKAQVMRIARLAGHPERGLALNARIDAAIARAAPARGSAPVSALVWQSGGIVPGADTLVSELLGRTGFASQSAALGLRQADYLPLERVLADPPRVILAAGDPRASEDRMLAHPALSRLADTRRERLDPALLWCGGPTIPRLAERLAEVRRGL